MSSRSTRALALVSVLLLASLAPLAVPAAAHSAILLSTDTSHVVLQPGDATNVTLTIENNGSSIESFNISVDDSGLSNVWTVTAVDATVDNVFPTWTRNTTIVVQLATGALPSDGGSFLIEVTEPDQNITSSVVVYVNVQPSYNPLLDFSSSGPLLEMAAGASGNVAVDITNGGSVADTLLLDVDFEPDLAAWWASNGNATGGNGTGNGTGSGNGTGNGTGSGNGTGNNTGGNISQVWSTPVTLDNSTNNVGEQSSLAIDSNNHLHVAYLDYTSFNLEYVTYDGSSWSTPVSIDSTADAWQPSLAIDSNDNLHVTYYDIIYDNLEYMTYDGSSWSTPVSIDSTGDVGGMSSLAIDSNDHLHVTYLDNANGNLEYMTYDGSSWSTPVTLDNGYNVGYYSSLAIDSNDNLHVTYQDEVYDNLEYVTYDGSSWSSPVTLDSTDDLGYHSSLAIDSNDNLHVTYLDYTNYNLEYMTYDGSSWSTPVSIDSTDDVGWQSSLAIDSNDNLHVTYLDNTNDNLEYMTHDGSSWSTPVSLDSTDDVGSDSSLAIDSNDNLHVTYYDYTNENLEYMIYSNSAGGNNTGGNGTGGANTTTISNVLMFGNSYTGSNNLASLMESLGVVNADSITPGGKMLSGHWDDINTSLHISNTTLRNPNIDWDYVVLQDQSQVPSLPTNDTFWQASKNGAVNISTEVSAEGSETVLFMTWGRRSGESGPQWHQYNINQNYTIMQERLADGYTHYAENLSAAGNTVWIAPVGLAFKHIHDAVEGSGTDPTQSGNLFYDLYSSDGSHPSLAGSYLAACVLYATMTGTSPVGSNDTVSLNANIKLQLQQAAAATVFNETSHLDYPWESSSTTSTTSARGLGGGVPAGWNVQWVDDQLDNMSAGETRQVTLQISVPADVTPDFYGFRLYAASTQGNVSSSTIVVVHVDEQHNLSMAFLDQDADFIPGSTQNTSVVVTNTGNAEADFDWSIESISGPCAFALPVASALAVSPDQAVNVAVQVDVPASATIADSCTFSLSGSTPDGSAMMVAGSDTFTIAVDEHVEFEVVALDSVVEVEHGAASMYNVRLYNNGSETRSFNLEVVEVTGLDTVVTSSLTIDVAAGETGLWAIETQADEGTVGDFIQFFEVIRGDQTSTTSVEIEVLPTAQIELAGPLDGRILMQPGSTSSTVLTVTNTGTGNVSLVASLSGLPASVQAEISHTSLSLTVGETAQVHLNLSLANNADPGTHPLTIGFGGSGASATTSIDLQIQDRFAVLVSTTSSDMVAGPANNASATFDVTNLGTSTDIYQLSIVDASQSDWFSFTLSTTSVTVGAGETATVELSVREISTGATSNGITVALLASSGTDENAEHHVNLTVRPQIAGATITVIADDDEAKPGSSIRGTVVVQNSGTGQDQLLLTTVGLDCGVTAQFNLEAGASSSAIPWSCVIEDTAQSGLGELLFRVTSSARSEYVATYTEIYSVEPSWDASNVLQVTTDLASYAVPYSGGTTLVVTVENLANTQVSGSLDFAGEGSAMLLGEWSRYVDNASTSAFVLAPFASVDFELTLTSNVQNEEDADLFIKVTYTIDATTTTSSDQSPNFAVEVAGPAQAPQGVTLPLGFQLDQNSTLNALIGGWVFSLLLLSVMYIQRSRRGEVEVESEDQDDEVVEEASEPEPATLGYNECRMEDGKVSCPSCDARLGVPRSSVAPFRFTCPKCQTTIRVIE